jgi:branched-chain amino acid transport system ATP-binding protein
MSPIPTGTIERDDAQAAMPATAATPASHAPMSARPPLPETGKATDLILKVSNIESYYGPIMAIRGVSIEVPRGQIVTVLGANGAGKTTILKTISGVLDPLKGTVEFEGKPIQRMDADRIVRLGLGHVPEGREVFPFLSVSENLAMGAFLRTDKAGVAEDLERIFTYFPRLKERLNQPAGQLSGGEQQMLAISRALMNRPKLLLLDEPSLGLSPLLVKEIFSIIRRVNAEQGVSILLVEQNAKMALETAHYGYVLEVGRVVMADHCERLMQSKDIQEFYLGAKEENARGERRWKKKKTWR